MWPCVGDDDNDDHDVGDDGDNDNEDGDGDDGEVDDDDDKVSVDFIGCTLAGVGRGNYAIWATSSHFSLKWAIKQN